VDHVGLAHTDGDAAMHLRKSNVIYTGDVFFNGVYPYIDLGAGGSVRGNIAALNKILALADEDTRLIPGHGPLGDKADLQAATDMLEDAAERIGALIDAGHTLEEVLEKNPLAEYHDDWNWRFISTERMTRTVYLSLSGE
ncbi:MAG: MBL fold metallo-hydrolase, partial [Pseudomonadota bacterium]